MNILNILLYEYYILHILYIILHIIVYINKQSVFFYIYKIYHQINITSDTQSQRCILF